MNDEAMISAIIRRDERVLSLCIQKYSRLLWKIAASVLNGAASAQDVEECVADVFIYLWQHPEKYDPNRAKLASWLSVIARSRAVDRYRRIVRNREIPLEDVIAGYMQSTAATADSQEEKNEKLRFCIGELEEKEKELIVRRYYYGQKPAQIAVALDMPRKQVENRLYHARQKLKKMMERQGGDRLYGKI